MSYRYEPETGDVVKLCTLMQEKLPEVDFSFQLNNSNGLLRAIGKNKGKYFELLLRDQSPAEVVEMFSERLKK